MLDFNKLLNEERPVQPTEPQAIYNSLDRRGTVSGDLRDAQKNILNDWYNNHSDDKDVIVKLHTGEGKTLVGMLILLSRMYSGKGPCIYVCPNKQLAVQASLDATKFGIPHVLFQDGEIPTDFTEKKKILVTHVQKVFNGRTVFGLDNNALQIGTFVLDDSHACIDSIKSNLSIKIGRTNELFTKFMRLFETELRKQAEGTYLDIDQNLYASSVMAVPYWDWIEKKEEVLKLLMDNSEDDDIKFVLPILRDTLQYCTAYISGRGIEIAPYCSMIERFTSFHKAKQRVLMSATTQDDSFFIKGLGLSKHAVLNPLTDETSKWSGEKMIIFPSLIDERLGRDYMRGISVYLPKLGPSNVSVLVPNNYICKEYVERGATHVKGDNIDNILSLLKNGPQQTPMVFVNRYDGIDLADDMCRILVIDSLPGSTSLCDRYEVSCREGSDIVNIKTAQKIEQGLGRSVRSLKDYTVILVVGTDIVKFMKSTDTQAFFSSQTVKQIEIGAFVSDQLKGEKDEERPFLPVKNLIDQCLGRDSGWKNYYSSEMNKIGASKQEHPMIDIIEKERQADIFVLKNDIPRACDIYKSIADEVGKDSLDYGWYLQEAAKYSYFINKPDSLYLQQDAYRNNTYILRPDNVSYKKIHILDDSRLKNIRTFINKFANHQDLKLYVDAVLSDFSFGVSAEKFEEAVKNIGLMLGFVSDRPDKTIGKGPDNLWGVKKDTYIAIECKDEVKLDRETISKEEVGQMENHCGWFESEYGICDVTYIMIHPTNKVSPSADFSHTINVMTPDKLNTFKQCLSSFVKEFARHELSTVSDDTLNRILVTCKLDIDNLKKKNCVNVVK